MIKAVKSRPDVRKSLASKLRARKTLKGKKPAFQRQEGYRHVKLKDGWRRPRGKQSKLRMREKARGSLPGAGYGSPRGVRGLNRLGYREVLVNTPSELADLNPREEMAVIAGAVGRKKREEIVRFAQEKKIHVSNV
ncbi:MAG: 50S ribosomal protein L32e [Candidatus Aenigmarchaeota archaeon]|nr:50S ribosomal protein L32e [Candidatus Aenigmarchaeota archaeon]